MKNVNLTPSEILEQDRIFESNLAAVNYYINKNYLMNLSSKKVITPEQKDLDISKLRLFYIDRFVYDHKENINDKMVSVYSAIHELGGNAVLILSSNGTTLRYYLGVRSQNDASLCGNVLSNSLRGNFPGSSISMLKNLDANLALDEMIGKMENGGVQLQNVSAVSIVPSSRDEDKDKFVQGIEKFIDTMQGNKYTAVFIASPISKENLETRKRGLEELSSLLSPLQKTTLAYGENFSTAVSQGTFENFSKSVNRGISNTNGYNQGTNSSVSTGRSSGFGLAGLNSGSNKSRSTGFSSGTNWSRSVTEGETDTTGTGTNSGNTETTGDSRTLTVEHINKSIEVILKTIDEQLQRIKDCEAYGLWDSAAYFLSPEIQISVMAANTFKAIVSGDSSGVENAYINIWRSSGRDASFEHLPDILSYIHYGLHPRMLSDESATENIENQIITPGSYISGKEIPLLMGLPQKSVTGLTVSAIAEFGRNIYMLNGALLSSAETRMIPFGKVFHMGKTEQTEVLLNLDSLTSHCFITGSTGSGKSNTSYVLLNRLYQNNIPFLVIEPAKGEYRTEFGGLPGINVFSTNPKIGRMLQLNPFRFDLAETHVLEHLDRLIEIFNACWEMYAAMPAILKSAVEQIYIDLGWDLLNSVYLGEGDPQFPTFTDLLRALPTIINTSGYSADTQSDYTGALVTRIASLTHGITGQIFCSGGAVSDEVLFDETTIVDLSRVGSTETKSLIMGLLVMKLSEYRMAKADGSNSRLRHVTVLEEAHNLLKRTITDQGQQSANVIGKSVEMISNSIAEMRTYGEGFIIIDQSPSAVDIAAVKNTNTKIVMRLPEKSDCDAIGNAMALNEDQIKELSKLPTGVAAVIQSNWLESVLVKVDAADRAFKTEKTDAAFDQLRAVRASAVEILLLQYFGAQKFDVEEIKACVRGVNAPDHKKKELLDGALNIVSTLSSHRDGALFCDLLTELSCCKALFDIMNARLLQIDFDVFGESDAAALHAWKSEFECKIFAILPIDQSLVPHMLRVLVNSKSREDLRYTDVYKRLYLS